MCGIVGYIGQKEAKPILLAGLRRLEYRGYDSAGAALCDKRGTLHIYKTKGKVKALEELMGAGQYLQTCGIAHTRWATHGEPSTLNAHPHFSQNEELAIVHNGIIENFREIKQDLMAKGFTFQSETDTEVLVQLILFVKQEYHLDLYKAVQYALQNVIGAYAIAVIDKENPNTIVVARKSSPLVIGVGSEYTEFYIGSDATPIIEYTRNVIFLDDEEVAKLTPGESPLIETIHGKVMEHEPSFLTLDIGSIEKGGYPHFMLKEIYEQPRCLRDCISGRIASDMKSVILSSIIDHGSTLINARRFVIVACGTSWHAALVGKQLIEDLVRKPVEVEYASEFRYRNPIIGAHDVVIAISQSGETADTYAALKLAKDRGAFTYAFCNTVGSTISRLADTGTYIHVGPEIGVASTKAFTGQIMVLAMFALALSSLTKTIEQPLLEDLIQCLAQIPSAIEKILDKTETIKDLAKVFKDKGNCIYLGRGYNYPVALEGALKLKELSYIHAEGYPAAEMKHGPIALVDENMPIIVVATKDKIYEKIVSNIMEMKARRGKIIAIISAEDQEIKKVADYVITVPQIHQMLEPLLTVIPLQLLAYYIAIEKGCNVDQPRNLAKSVTVE